MKYPAGSTVSWEVYEGHKPTYRDVVQYRPIYYSEYKNDYYVYHDWASKKQNGTSPIGYEERTIRIYKNGRVEVIE